MKHITYILVSIISLVLVPLNLKAQFSNKPITGDYYGKVVGKASDSGNVWTCVSEMPNGKIIVGGFINHDYRFRLGALECLLPSGKKDSSFLNNGFFQFIINENKGCEVIDLKVQTDGKILVLGTTQNKIGNGYSVFLLRLLPNGENDLSFINGTDTGMVQLHNNGIHPKLDNSLSKYYEGKIEITNEELMARKFTTEEMEGNYQPYFQMEDTSLITSDLINEGTKVIIQPDGKYLVIGKTHTPYEDAESFVVRINTDASIDTSFGFKGIFPLNLTDKYDKATDMVLQPDGKIIIVGNANEEYESGIANPLRDVFVVRLLNNGSLDKSFNNGQGYLIKDVANEENSAKKVLILPNNKIQLFGETKGDIPNSDLAKNDLLLLQLNSDGSFNTNYGTEGVKTINILGYDIVEDAQLTSENKILILGNQYNRVKEYKKVMINKKGQRVEHDKNTTEEEEMYTTQSYVARLLLNGELDTTLYKNGKIFYTSENLAIATELSAMAMLTDNDIVLVGKVDKNYNSKTLIVKSLIELDLGKLSCTKTNQIDYVYPNPVYQSTTIKYELCMASEVTIELYNIEGKKVQTFYQNTTKELGTHEDLLEFNESLNNGTYIIVVKTPQGNNTIKVQVNR